MDPNYDQLERGVYYLRNVLKSLRKVKHYLCEDGWYSCPKSESYLGDEYESVPIEKRPCFCGMDKTNAKIDAALKETERLVK
jgi:hypothetical protein